MCRGKSSLYIFTIKSSMRFRKKVPLKNYNTFGLDYTADSMISVNNKKEAITLFKGDTCWEKPLLILGSGSNVLFTEDFNGTILRPEFGGITIEEQHPNYVIISAGAGIIWDNLVEWTVVKGFWGLENLSLIPGMVGATPVQNIGAYGVEIKDRIEKVETIFISDGSLHEFSNKDCEFGYRSSIFKSAQKGKYLITRVFYKLDLNPAIRLNYGSLEEEVVKLGDLTLKNIRLAVINIRKSKLPDPEITGNAGSFFKNPVISISGAANLKNKFPLIPSFDDTSGGIKLSAAWMIDQCGWRGKRKGDAGVHDKQALVLVNHGQATGKEIYLLAEEIKKSVKQTFGVDLEREVEVIGTI
jgi:UDP-N-acetylmuramate dehydrogenase